MKLSDAIRLGAMAIPAVHGPVINFEGSDGSAVPCGACLLGTVLIATEPNLTYAKYMQLNANEENGVDGQYGRIHIRWPWTTAEVTFCGLAGHVPLVAMLAYEFGRQSREQIADWVETIEVQQAPAAVDPVEGAQRPIEAPQAVHARI